MYLALLGGCFWLAGCVIPVPVPGTQTTSSHLHGRIIDSASQQPVEGAKVMISDRPGTAVQTDSAGRFDIERVREFYLIHFASRGVESNFPRTSRYCSKVEVSHPGYEGVEFDIQEAKWVAAKPAKASDPYLLADVLLVPKRK